MEIDKLVKFVVAVAIVASIIALQEARADWVHDLGDKSSQVSEKVLHDSTEEAIAFATEAYGEVHNHSVVSSNADGIDQQVIVECMTDKGLVYITVGSDGFDTCVEGVSKTV